MAIADIEETRAVAVFEDGNHSGRIMMPIAIAIVLLRRAIETIAIKIRTTELLIEIIIVTREKNFDLPKLDSTCFVL